MAGVRAVVEAGDDGGRGGCGGGGKAVIEAESEATAC